MCLSLCLLAILPRALAMVFSVSMNADTSLITDFGISTEDSNVLPTKGFGLLVDGNVSIQLKFSRIESPVALMIMNEAQFPDYETLINSIERSSSFEASWCALPALYRKQFTLAHGEAPIQFELSYTAPQTDRYYVVMANCDAGSVTVDGEIRFLNPGAVELSYEQLALRQVYKIAIGLDSAILTAWLAYLLYMRNNVRLIHQLITSVSASKVIYEALLLGYIGQIASTGSDSAALLTTQLMFGDLLDSMSLLIALMIGAGFSINRSAMHSSERNLGRTVFLLTLFMSIILRAKVCSTSQVCSSILILKYSLIFFLLFGIVLMLNLSIVKIREIVLTSVPLSEEGVKRFDRKFSLYHDLRVTFATYLMCIPIIIALRATVSWQNRWVDEVFRLGTASILQVVLLCKLRPTKDMLVFDYLEW